MCLIFNLCLAPHYGVIPILRRMREQHETDAEDEEDSASEDADDAREFLFFNLVHIAPHLRTSQKQYDATTTTMTTTLSLYNNNKQYSKTINNTKKQ